MFYATVPSVQPVIGEWLSLNMLTFVYNGLIVFKNVWVFIVGDGVGIVWSSLVPYPVEVSRIFSLYSYAIPWRVYWMCNLLHIGSAVTCVLVLWFTIQLFRFTLDIILFVTSGFLTREERFVRRNTQWMELDARWHEISDTTGVAARNAQAIAELRQELNLLKKVD